MAYFLCVCEFNSFLNQLSAQYERALHAIALKIYATLK